MQTGDQFIFFLDAPREQTVTAPCGVLGWIAALEPISEVALLGAATAALAPLPRPDVQRAFPGHPHVIGFSGLAHPADFQDGALRFSFRIGATPCQVAEPLPPPVRAPVGARRWALRAQAAWARGRLRGSPSPKVRWNEGLRLLLARLRLQRGSALFRPEGDLILGHLAQAFPEAVVLQIGANDGVAGDPLARWFESTRWRGVLVEPIPHLAQSLARRYAGRAGLRIEAAAIGETDGESSLYRIAHYPGDPDWFQQLATFERAVLLKHRSAVPGLEARIVEEKVPTLTVRTLLGRHQLRQVDLLVIDTEGHDYRILRQFDFTQVRPLVLMFEHQHLAPADKAAAYALLRRHAYHWIEMPEGDCLAWRPA